MLSRAVKSGVYALNQKCTGHVNRVDTKRIAATVSENSAQQSAKRSETSLPLLHISTAALDNKVAIWIADNGPGISLEIQDRIFDPFFTTKAVGEGAGLGLSISHQIVTVQHGGKIKCYSVPGQGTKFLVELPIVLAAKGTANEKLSEPTACSNQLEAAVSA